MTAIAGLDFTGTIRSLLNIEVNTIISDSMTAEQMPLLPHAILDVAGWYADLLCEAGVDLQPFFQGSAADLPALSLTWTTRRSFSSDMLRFSTATFDGLRWAAKKAGGGDRLSSTQRVLLDRICNNADTVKEMFKRFGPDIMAQFGGKNRAELIDLSIDPNTYYVPPDELVALQKIWDLGTDEVVAQTIVFLNGNVTTRIQALQGHPGAELLFAVHRQSVDVSVGCWQYLLQAIREIAGAAVSTLFARKP